MGGAAVVAVAAGAAAGAASQVRMLEEIDRSFDTPQLREDARVVFDLINESEGGNTGVAIIFFMLGFPSGFGGAMLGERLAGELGTGIGALVGLLLWAASMFYVDRRWFKRPARRRLRRFVKQHPQGRHIEEKVRAIIDQS